MKYGPARWKPSSRLIARALGSHSTIGLAFCALIYLLCFTGTLSVLVDEMQLMEQPTPTAGQLHPGMLNSAVAAVLAREPAAAVLYAVAPTTPRQRLTVTAEGSRGERSYLADSQGSIVAQHTPFADFVTDLHMTLTAPEPWGSLIVGIAGVALLALIISGLIAHPRIFRDAFRLRLNGSRRLYEAELHNRLSVWGLPFHVAITLSGALFGLTSLAVATVAGIGFHGDSAQAESAITGPGVIENSQPAHLPDLEALIARAQALIPGSHLTYVGVERPGTRGARIEVEVGMPGRLPRGETIYFDVHGTQIGRGRFLSGPAGLQIYSGAAEVHFGFFGGLPIRIVYVLLGAALTFVAASGFAVWLERQGERGRPHRRLRAVWRAWTRGIPAALALAALASRVVPVSWTFWSVVGLVQGLALWRGASKVRLQRQ